MIIYNVTIKVSHDIALEWVNWMKQEHIPDLLLTGLFVDYRFCKMLKLTKKMALPTLYNIFAIA